MANSEIAGLTEDTTPDPTDNIYAQDAAGSTDKRVPLSALSTITTTSTTVDDAGAVMESDYDANTILRATSDNTPTALTVGEQTLIGRITAGAIAALTAAQVRTLLNVEDGATADQSAAEILAALLTVDGAGSGIDADLLDGQSSAAFATAAQGAKVDFLTVTQPVDLDAIETRVASLDAAVVLRGSWDASAGTFPGSGSAQAGDSYIVSVAGTVDSVAFSVGDRVIAILDNASTTTYASNWLKLDYTDQVLSVDGRTGAVTLSDLYQAAGTYYSPGGTDVAITDGGTGASTAADAFAALKQDASTTATGVVELATTAETEIGTDATRAVTPDGLHDMTTLAGAAWFLDEDAMTSDSATKVPSQQSVKAYADQSIADLPENGAGLVVSGGFVNVNAIDVQTFTSSGTWTKPDGCTKVLAILIGGGGGGASGYRNAEGVLRYGGGGGAPGSRAQFWIDEADLDATEAVTIGAAGTGGAAVTTNAAGNDGTAGGDTILDTIAGDVRGLGGQQGYHLAGFSPGGGGVGALGRGGVSLSVGPTPADVNMRNGFFGGGGAGNTRTAANAIVTGGSGGATDGAAGGVVASPATAGGDGAYGAAGGGGGGGGGAAAGGGVAGAAGGVPGGGGGGGAFGNAGTPTNSGAGGDGGRGEAWIISFR